MTWIQLQLTKHLCIKRVHATIYESIIGLCQICKDYLKCFQEFPKFSPIMLFQCSHYACIMLLGKQQFFYSNVKSECSIRVFNYKVTILLESIDLKVLCVMYSCFAVTTDCSIRECRSILKGLSSTLLNIYLIC